MEAFRYFTKPVKTYLFQKKKENKTKSEEENIVIGNWVFKRDQKERNSWLTFY